MQTSGFRASIMRFVSLSIICMGFAQVAPAGMIGTNYLLAEEDRAASLSHLETLLARDDVARQLETFGVDKALLVQRLDAMSAAELRDLEGTLDQQLAGGDALGIIGAVFLVLLILEIVGVTNVFSGI